MTDAAVDEVGEEEAGEDVADGVADPTPGCIDMADSYTIAAQRASRRACGWQGDSTEPGDIRLPDRANIA
jgi:hypothetical protein